MAHRRFLFILLSFLVFSSFVNASLYRPTSSIADATVKIEVLGVSSLPPMIPRLIVPSGENDEGNVPLSSSPSLTGSFSPGGHSTLTLREALLVMGSGRMVDLKTGKRTERKALTGLLRENFLLSWEAQRVRNNVRQLIPGGFAYSQATSDSFIKFD